MSEPGDPGSKSKARSNNNKNKSTNFLRLNLPGMGLLRKFQQYRRIPQETGPVHHLEEELDRLTNKIDSLLNRIDGQDLEPASSQEEECVVCGSNKATMQTLPCAHKVVCRQCFVRTIQMAVAQKRLPLRCILCRAKVLRLHQDNANKETNLPKSVSGYNIAYNISSSGSNYSFTSGVSAVSSESSSSRKSSLARDFSFSSLSNFQNVNLLNKSQIPRSKSGGFASRRARRSRSPSPAGSHRSRSAETGTHRSVEIGPPRIKIDRTPSDESLFNQQSPISPTSPLSRSSGWGGGPRSPSSPTSPISPGDAERIFPSRGGSRLSTPLSPIKESRKEMGSLAELQCSPAREAPLKLQDVPKKKPSSRIRCAEKILSQLESETNNGVNSRHNQEDLLIEGGEPRGKGLNKLSEEDIANFEGSVDHPALPSRVKTSKSVSFKDC